MSSSSADKANAKATEAKNKLLSRLREDGVQNPAGFSTLAFSFVFFGFVPVTTWLAQPNSLVERLVNGLVRTVAFVGSAGSTSTVASTGKIAALSTLYIAATYAVTGAGSAAGVDAGTEGGRDNSHPRAQEAKITGLPLRLTSAHHQIVENFGGFALSAALAQAIAPGDQTVVNLLGLHVISKLFIYYPAYLFNIAVPRTLAHVVATASVIGVGLQLAKKPLI